MIEFIAKIFKKWFGIFSLIASFSGLLLFYTGLDTNSLIVNLFKNNWLIVSLIFLLISSFQVWLDTQKEKIALENKLKNPIDYKVKAYKRAINIDLQYLENLFDENIKKSSEILMDINSKIKNLSTNNNSETDIAKLLSSVKHGIYDNLKSDELYIQELKQYKTKLIEYPKKKETFLLNWKNFIDNELKNIYFVHFTIKNIGILSDEDIDIEIEIMHNNKYITDLYTLENFPKMPSLPEKPKREIATILRQKLNHDLDLSKMHRLSIDSNPLTYRRYETIDNNKFSIKLRDLKVSEEVSIFRQDGFFIYIDNENNFHVRIISKKSNSAIQKKIIFIKDKDYNYFKKN